MAGGKVTAINKPTGGLQRATHDQAHQDQLRVSPCCGEGHRLQLETKLPLTNSSNHFP
jgi:hypothetical protein